MTSRLPETGGEHDSRRAHSWSIHTCGECPNAHIALRDENGVIFADFIIAPDQVRTFVEGVSQALIQARQENIARQNDE